jgi:tetratricopeptide (TPR) repeat protein
MHTWARTAATGFVAASLWFAGPVWGGSPEPAHEHLKRAKVFLAAGDYRRAIEACQHEVEEAPSAESYVYLTYVYQALDGYLEAMAKSDRWVAVEQVYLSLATRNVEEMIDPPDVLARIAKEITQESMRRQSDITAAMAARLDKAATERLWKQQTEWRKAHPENWWSGLPEGWHW